MSAEDLCTYELSRFLKRLGFDEPCYNYWSLEPDGKPCIVTATLCHIRNSDLKGRDITAPFLWHAQKWLRKKKHYHIVMMCIDTELWLPVIYDMNKRADNKVSNKMGRSYEEALSIGIMECLNLLEKEA